MPFGVGGFNPPSKSNFSKNFSKDLGEEANFKSVQDWQLDANPFKFTPKEEALRSRIRFYDHDSLWSRWRRGYELYTITQSVLGSFAKERATRGDYRMYCTFQQFPGVFIPARIFTFPTTNSEIGEQMVGMRDTNGFNFYKFGLPILAVRYLGPAVTATYSQVGTTITVTQSDHGLRVGENVYLDILTGGGIDATLAIVSRTQNTFLRHFLIFGGQQRGSDYAQFLFLSHFLLANAWLIVLWSEILVFFQHIRVQDRL